MKEVIIVKSENIVDFIINETLHSGRGNLEETPQQNPLRGEGLRNPSNVSLIIDFTIVTQVATNGSWAFHHGFQTLSSLQRGDIASQ